MPKLICVQEGSLLFFGFFLFKVRMRQYYFFPELVEFDFYIIYIYFLLITYKKVYDKLVQLVLAHFTNKRSVINAGVSTEAPRLHYP